MKFLDALTTFILVVILILCIFGWATDVPDTAGYVKPAVSRE